MICMSSCALCKVTTELASAGTGGNAIDPVSKFWLTFRLGERGLGTVQSLVHQLVQQLAPGVIPLFLPDGERSFETSLLSHYGHWGQIVDGLGRSRGRWLGLAELAYV
jgi:hypothetical protein